MTADSSAIPYLNLIVVVATAAGMDYLPVVFVFSTDAMGEGGYTHHWSSL
jgi:uncharacterized membrane protein